MAGAEALVRAEFIDPGTFRHELALEVATRAPDGAGGYTETWSEVATLFGRIDPVSAANRFGADKRTVTVTHRVTLRSRGDIAHGMRLCRQERVFEIITVHDPDETGRYLVCEVREERS